MQQTICYADMVIHQRVKKLLPTRLTPLFRLFFRDEAASGRLILLFAALAVIVANSPLNHYYTTFWQTTFTIGFGSGAMTDTLRYWVNDGLMAVFFFVVGIEIKREFTKGELRNRSQAVLPVAAAVGGMLLPAAIYAAFNFNRPTIDGWGIPIATDIAFAVGVLALLGSRIPSYLKIFLLTLAIVDDMLAIIVIGVFYASTINPLPLLVAVFFVMLTFLTSRLKPNSATLYIAVAILLWLAIKSSGVHASIAGALSGLMAPIAISSGRDYMAERLEKGLLPFSTFFVIPVFVFANAGVVLSLDAVTNPEVIPIILGILFGLVFGKAFGVLGASWLVVKLGFAQLPIGVSWLHILGLGLLAGIGFTVSIFITTLAFVDNEAYINAAKISIFVASITAAALGMLTLRIAARRAHRHG